MISFRNPTLVSSLFVLLFNACGQPPPEETREELEQREVEQDSLAAEEVDSAAQAINDSLQRVQLRGMFEDSLMTLYRQLNLEQRHLGYEAFRFAMIGYYHLQQEHRLSKKKLVSIIDFTQSSCDKRFYTIDLERVKLLFNTYVGHGRNTGENFAQVFSNKVNSNQSSLGFYVTGETYTGSKGFSMRLDGMEKGYNSNIRKRSVVMHAADYVSEDFIKRYGRLGRSQGCPALPAKLSKKVINTIKNKTVIFAYYSDDEYLKASRFLDLNTLMRKMRKAEKEQARLQRQPKPNTGSLLSWLAPIFVAYLLLN